MVKILDISHHQPPASLNYDELANQVDWVIIRTQYGSNLIDKHYKTHHREFQKRGIPTAAYAWLRGVSIEDMKVEARDFYNRTKEFNPTFWFLDVEEKSMNDMRAGTSAFLKELRRLGAKKVGIYVGHHLYKSFNLNLSEADAVWIPHYGKNNGTINSKPAYSCDIHQYTDKGRLRGYNGPLDLNRILSDKKLSYFIDGGKPSNSSTKKSMDAMAKEIIDGKHGKGHEVRRKSLGITKTEYEKVREKVNHLASAEKKKKPFEIMVKEVMQGKHGNGHETRRKSLGITKAEYDKVKKEVNKRLSSNQSKSIKQMADEVYKGLHGNGHEARRKSLGISKEKYEKVKNEVNKRFK